MVSLDHHSWTYRVRRGKSEERRRLLSVWLCKSIENEPLARGLDPRRLETRASVTPETRFLRTHDHVKKTAAMQFIGTTKWG